MVSIVAVIVAVGVTAMRVTMRWRRRLRCSHRQVRIGAGLTVTARTTNIMAVTIAAVLTQVRYVARGQLRVLQGYWELQGRGNLGTRSSAAQGIVWKHTSGRSRGRGSSNTICCSR